MGIAKDIVLQSLPISLRLPAWYLLKKINGTLDEEIGQVKKKIDTTRGMIDIGANIGIYTHALKNSCRFVHAFEPQPQCLKVLTTTASDRITVHPMALSDAPGELELHIPVRNGCRLDGLASFRPLTGEVEVETVPVATLDSFGFTDIGFLKIDVEGHEMKVLGGATATIHRERPIILIEIEQRHIGIPITDIFSSILSLGYTGGFYLRNEWHPIASFDYSIHQQPFEKDIQAEKYRKLKGAYVNNFIFEPVAELR